MANEDDSWRPAEGTSTSRSRGASGRSRGADPDSSLQRLCTALGLIVPKVPVAGAQEQLQEPVESGPGKQILVKPQPSEPFEDLL